jgi:Domain of unknown function (DUF4129)
MRSTLVVCLIALFSLTTLSAAGQSFYLKQAGTTITVDKYWERIGQTQQSIIELEGKPEAKIRQQLNALASQWDLITAAELSDHSIIQIDSTYLATELRSAYPDLKHLEKSLDALLQAHKEFPQNVFTIKDVDPLKQILARPEFQWDSGQTVEMPRWLGNLLDVISKFLDRLIFVLANLIYQGRILLMVGAAILLLLVLFYISRNLSRSLVQNAQLAGDSSEGEGMLTSKGAIQRAQSLSTQGDYRNAIRYLYLSSLLVLDEQGLLRYDRSLTNREYLRSISSRPELANPLRDVIEVFDRVWYGFESVDEQTYQSYKEHVEELREKKE